MEELPGIDELAAMPDPELFEWRRLAREDMQLNPDPALQARYEQTTDIVEERARQAWTNPQ